MAKGVTYSVLVKHVVTPVAKFSFHTPIRAKITFVGGKKYINLFGTTYLLKSYTPA